MGELVATLALAQDNAFGQPLESQLRSCLLAHRISEAAGLSSEEVETVHWVALLRYIGCTGHAHEVASLFGDEIAIRAQTLVHDAANPAEVMRDVLAFATAGRPPEEHTQIAQAIQEGAHTWAVHNFASGCEVGDMIVEQLGFAPPVREALRFTFERWNGAGFPNGIGGDDIPVAMLVVHLSHDMEAIARRFTPALALEAANDRRDRTYHPGLADIFVEHGADWFDQLTAMDPWNAVLDMEPKPHRRLHGAELDDALTTVADFIDLKSPYMNGHSRRCATLAERAARLIGFDDDHVMRLRRAGLVHELGTTAIPNSILDKPGALSRAERDRIEVHPMFTEQMLRRSSALEELNPIAACHHESADGSGYHKHLRADALDEGALVLAAADIYVALTTDRADRRAFSPEDAAVELRRLTDHGLLDGRSADAVLAAAGHGEAGSKVRRRPNPGGLTTREVEVLRLAAQGRTTQEVADELFISAKTADHHIQHIYTKIGVSTRAAAALWAMRNEVVH
jgi:HD-GYP domain-containing protein (c-di-GMP phosphodiesterase class II)